MVVTPNPKDSWVMGWPSLVLGWSIICLIKRERHHIIELLTPLAESHLSSDSGRDSGWFYEFIQEPDPDYRLEILRNCPAGVSGSEVWG